MNQVFTGNDPQMTGVWVSQLLLKRANELVPKLQCLFPFSIDLLESTVFPTQYRLLPANTIIVQRKHQHMLVNVLIHELAHHVWHRLIKPNEKSAITQIGYSYDVDPNEQFASCAEYAIRGSCLRFEKHVTSEDTTTQLATDRTIVSIVGLYFRLPSAKG